MTTLARDPEHIAISKARGIEIDWKDGHHSSYSTAYLRDECPCAMCTGSHGTEPQKTSYNNAGGNPFPMFKPSIRMNEVEPMGNYAVKIHWNDGHSSGIYSFDYLRSICECAACKPPTVGKTSDNLKAI